MRSASLDMIEPSEGSRRFGPTQQQQTWEQILANICVENDPNGCGDVLSAQRITIETEEGMVAIVAASVKPFW